MRPDEIRELFDDPVARELLSSQQLARLAYSAPDGSPRVIPIAFAAREDRILHYSEPSAPKYAALKEDPRVALTIDAGSPPRALLIRGVAEIDVGPSYVEEYLDFARAGNTDPDAWPAFEAQARALYQTMGRITVRPTWAKILDFERRMPDFLDRLMRARS